MKQHVTAQRLVLMLALIACSICFFSFSKTFRQHKTSKQKTFRNESSRRGDTSTRCKLNRGEDEYIMRSLDAAMKNLDEGLRKPVGEIRKWT